MHFTNERTDGRGNERGRTCCWGAFHLVRPKCCSYFHTIGEWRGNRVNETEAKGSDSNHKAARKMVSVSLAKIL